MTIQIKKQKISNPENVRDLIVALLAMEAEIDREKEHFWVIGLHSNGYVKFVDLVSLGILAQAIVHPREVFRTAILNGAYSIIIVHNHPSGYVNPSPEDKKLTEILVEAGNLLAMPVLDHVIVANDPPGYYSFQEFGKIKMGELK